MPEYQYFLSTDPSTPSPVELETIRADSPRDVGRELLCAGHLLEVWVHVLVWTSEDGLQRGFESLRLAEVEITARTPVASTSVALRCQRE